MDLRVRARNLLVGAAVVFATLALGAQSAAPAASPACATTTTERVVAIGDVHGAYDRFVAILRQAGLIDARDRWSGGRAILVQTGDLLDRGPDSRRALDLLRRLTGEARDAGGVVHPLLGNHEVMRMMRDMRYVSDREYAAFRSPASNDLRQDVYRQVADTARARARAIGQRFDEGAFRRQFEEQVPLGVIEMQAAFGPEGEYGRWLRDRDTMVKINDTVFVHGGITREVAALGCDGVNRTVRAELRAKLSLDDPRLASSLSVGPDGPLWYRGLADESLELPAADVLAVLSTLGASTIVVGHTVAPNLQIRTRYDGRVVQIDTGMLGGTFYPGGRASALEIKDGIFTAIADGKRQTIK